MRGRLLIMRYKLQNRQDELRKSIQRRLYHKNGRSMPVFLIGCGRSGTSMLVWQLEKSWQVQLYNEDHPAAFDVYRLRELDTIEALVAQSPAPMTLFKPILDTVQTPKLLAHFPTSKAIFAFRDYNDVINSSLKKFGINNRIGHVRRWMEDDFNEFAVASPPEELKATIRSFWQPDLSPQEGAALYWLFYNRLYYDLNLHEHDRVHLVRYESLVTQPQVQFEGLIQFLEAQFEERMVAGIFASSVNKNKAPHLNDQIRAACDELYDRMSQDVSSKEG